jgi:two-component system OmpR family sensor kinase
VTLRARLSLALGLLAVLLVASVVAILGLVHTSLVQQADRQLTEASRIAADPLVRRAPAPLPAPNGSQFSDLFIEQVAADGTITVLLRPTSASSGPDVSVAQTRARATPATAARGFDAHSADGRTAFRAVAIRTDGRDVIVIALSANAIEATFRRVSLGVMLVAGLLFAALTLAGWWVERLGIRPIKRVTDAASAIAKGDLDRRAEAAPKGTEAGELARAFNIMADARQSSDEQLRRFVADASHELRTPLSTIAGVLELYNSGALKPGPDLDEALRRAAQEASRMSGLVADLLLLAALDQGRPLNVAEVSLASIVADAAFDAALMGGRRTVTTDVDPHAIVMADEERIRQVVANLVSNALTYAPVDGHIDLRACGDLQVCTLEVSDDGPGMPDDVAGHVFDRFYRADHARSRSRGGAGLGLSIVASIVAAHGGEVSVITAPGEGTTFRVVLPRHLRETQERAAFNKL